MTGTRARRGLVSVLVLLLCLAAYAVPSTRGALIGRIANTENSAATALYATCETAATGIRSAFFIHPLDETTGTVAADVSAGPNRPGTYRPSRGTAQANQPVCRGDGGRAVQLNGSTQFIGNNARQVNPQTFSVQLWFRTTTNGYNRGGRLIGFGNGTGTTMSTAYDRNVYMSNAGRIVFSVYPGAVREIGSVATFNDAGWHHVVATLAPSGSPDPGMRLYLDGELVDADESVTTARAYDGYWRVGWDNLDGYGSEPRSFYFNGRVAFAAVFTTALTPAQVGTLYQAGR